MLYTHDWVTYVQRATATTKQYNNRTKRQISIDRDIARFKVRLCSRTNSEFAQVAPPDC